MKSETKLIRLLEAFLVQEKLGISDLAAASGLSIGTTHRIAKSLVEEGYLQQEDKRGKYSLTAKLLNFSQVILERLRIADVARPFLYQLNQLTGETISMAVWDGYEAVQVTRIETDQVLRVYNVAGKKRSQHTTSTGKVLLANLDEGELYKYINVEKLPTVTPNAIKNLDLLKKELAKVRDTGIGVDNEESDLDVKSVAVPIKNVSGNVIAAIAVVGPVSRLNDRKTEDLIKILKLYGLKISQAMGYKS